MLMARTLGERAFSLIGISLIGSLVHVMTQFLLALLLFVQNAGILFLLPVLLVSGFTSGIVVGWIASRLLPIMESTGLHP
jgi:heptaprenyl diphosphate synthase